MPFDPHILARVLRILFRPRSLSPRRIAVNLTFLSLLWIVSSLRWFFQKLDLLLYPELRDFDVEAPVFVIANPRSGTTFLHRLMSLDDDRFTCMKTWQTILPSVTLYALVRVIARVDRRVGRPLGRLVRLFERKLFARWDGVHHVGLDAPEEEQTLFISTLIDPSTWMILPSPQEFRDIDALDDLDERRRARVMRIYRDTLRAHVFAEGRGKRILLSKNVFHAGRLRSILETFPDARIVHLVRHPYSSLASSCSMFTTPWVWHSPKALEDPTQTRYFADIGIDYYQRMHELEPELRGRGVSLHTYRYDDLVDDPEATVADIYDRLGLEISDAYARRLRRETAEARHYKSGHDYDLERFGVTRDEVYEAIPEIFEAYGFERDPRDTGDGVDAGVGPGTTAAEERADASASAPQPSLA